MRDRRWTQTFANMLSSRTRRDGFLSRRATRSTHSFGLHKKKKQGFETLEPRMLLAFDSLIISEFMADNDETLLDEDGSKSDWIEIHNPTGVSTNLDGWYLTDDAEDLTKWEFPAKTIAVDEYLVVFASGKDRTSTRSELHTNFQLSANGDYLGLIMPDGETVAFEYSPEFPDQLEDVSYGISDASGVETTLVSAASSASVLIPAAGFAADWTSPDYNTDGNWIEGSASVGFNEGEAAATSVLFVGAGANPDSGDDDDVMAHLETLFGPENVLYKSAATATAEDGTSGEFDVLVISSTSSSADVSGKWAEATAGVLNWDDSLIRTVSGGFQMAGRSSKPVGQTKLNIADNSHPVTQGFSTGVLSIASRPIEITVGINSTGAGVSVLAESEEFPQQFALMVADVGDELLGNGSPGKPAIADGRRVMFPLTDVGFGSLNSNGLRLFDNALQWISGQDDSTDLGSIIKTDLADAMHQVNGSALVRIPFDGDEIGQFQGLSLRMKYDDGFVAYINGTEVARRNAPGVIGDPLSADANATQERPIQQAVAFENIDISAFSDLVQRDQTNILSIQGLNLDASDNDFLIVPELIAISDFDELLQYYATPTPGAENIEGSLGTVADTKFSVERGFYDEPFEVEITTNTPGAEIRYTLDGTEPGVRSGSVYSGPISVGSTTNLRAAAFKTGFISTNVDTQTYIFIEDVKQQPDAPDGYPTAWSQGQSSDYGIDPEIVNSPIYRDRISGAFTAIPTLSIVSDKEEFFAADGIYIRSTDRPGREVAVSAELIHPDGTTQGFQVDAGIRIQGGASRNADRSPKHAFSLRFRDEYGDDRLNYPLFEGSKIDSFDTIQLRARYNNSWIHNTAGQRTRALLLRDQWARDAMFEMGNIDAGQGRPMHLYLNGLYWGIYMIQERNVASHFASYFGGSEDDYDAINGNRATDGTITAWNEMKATVNGGDWEAIQQVLDVDNYIDFLIVQFYGGNSDLKTDGNWRAAGGGPDRVPFRFYLWDTERILESVNQTSLSPTDNPAGINAGLFAIEEFRVRFGDRVQKHLFNGGALTSEKSSQRLLHLANQLEEAMVAESARWGDSKQSNPLTVDNEWITERDRLLNSYFPQRSEVAKQAFINKDLYSLIDAPVFEVNGTPQHGGQISPDDQIKLNGGRTRGTKVYYTLDGADPRLPGGDINPDALEADDPISLSESSLVKMRVRNGQLWSALVEAQFLSSTPADSTNLAVTELYYNPHLLSADEVAAGLTRSDFEFLEFQNIGNNAIDLTGARFVEGLTFTFQGLQDNRLEPGERAIIVKNVSAFEMRYGSGVKIVGQYEGSLGNNGEQLKLLAANDLTIFDFEYNDGGSFPGRADGSGSSLEVLDTAGNYNLGSNWRSSSEFGGSPGAEGSGARSDVVINEVLTHTDPPQQDAIELHNTTSQTIDIGGWVLSDSDANYKKYTIPQGTVIAAGGFVVFDEDEFNVGAVGDPNSFALSSSHGDDVWLLEADEAGSLISFVDHVEFGATLNGVSLGRWPDASGSLFPMTQFTPAAVNSGPRSGDVIISEVMYDALNAGDDDDLEYVELYNTTGAAVDLSEWRIRKGIDLNFDAGTMIDAGGVLVVLSFNPDKPDNVDRVAAFRDHYGIDESVTLVGGFAGKLDDGGDRVQLQQFDDPPVDEPDFTPHPLVDDVRYDDMEPWPTEADGGGKSLTRIATDAFGNLAGSWSAADPTPGSVSFDPPMETTDIAQVLAASSRWDAGFVHAGGFEVGDLPLPWIDIDQFSLVFSGEVNVSQSDLSIISSKGEDYTIDGFDYDSASRTATWTLSAAVEADKILLSLSSAVTDVAGVPLSGDLHHRIDILPGDISQNGIVDTRDVQDIRDAMLTITGDADYSALADLNGSGSVDIRDVQPLRVNMLSELPPGDPVPNFGLARELAKLDESESAYQWSSGKAAERRADAALALMIDDQSISSESANESDASDDWQAAVDSTLEDPDAWA